MLLEPDLVNRFIASAYAFQQLLTALLRYGYKRSGVDWLCIKRLLALVFPAYDNQSWKIAKRLP